MSFSIGGAAAVGAAVGGAINAVGSLLGLVTGSSNGVAPNEWPMPKFFFEVDIGGSNLSFQACDGLEASIAVMEFRDGNSQRFFKEKRPTMISFSPITLKKGVFAGNMDFYDWFKGVAINNFFGDMRTVKIRLLNTDQDGAVVFEWTLEKAFLTKFTPTPLDAEADSEVAIEEIEITYQAFSAEGGLLDALLGLF